VGDSHNWALLKSCRYGHLEVAQWLVMYFHLTKEDVQSENGMILQLCCENGQFNGYQLTIDDVFKRVVNMVV
jgi:hypothetical protein